MNASLKGRVRSVLQMCLRIAQVITESSRIRGESIESGGREDKDLQRRYESLWQNAQALRRALRKGVNELCQDLEGRRHGAIRGAAAAAGYAALREQLRRVVLLQ